MGEAILISEGAEGIAEKAEIDTSSREPHETLSVALSAGAAIATAWCAYQAATWSGEQTFGIANATRTRQFASELRLEGDQEVAIDVQTFIAFAQALADHEEGLQQFIRQRSSPPLRKALDAWMATNPLENHDAPAHPFAMPEYSNTKRITARAMSEEADRLTEHARAANSNSDHYVLGTVVLAIVLFFASVGPRFRSRRARSLAIGVSSAMLVLAVAWALSRPVSFGVG